MCVIGKGTERLFFNLSWMVNSLWRRLWQQLFTSRCTRLETVQDILSKFIRSEGSDLQTPLLLFTNLVVDQERVPHNRGTEVVVKLDTAKNSTDPGNFRGITLISIIRKLFSTMICLQLEKKVAIHESQCAFSHDRSCIDYIITTAQLVHESRFNMGKPNQTK